MAEQSFRITGADDLEKLAKRLKAEGGTELRKELLRGIRETNKPTVKKVKQSALDNLPKRGGLAAKVAKDPIGTRTRLTGNSAGVTIQRKRGRGLNEGRLRHPVFVKNRNAIGFKTGRGKTGHVLGGDDRKKWTWVSQKVSSHWFNKPIEDDAPHIRNGLQKVMQDVAAKITRGI